MAQREVSASWTFTSSGVGAWVDCFGADRELSFYATTTGDSSLVYSYQYETAFDSTSQAILMGSTLSAGLSTSLGVFTQFLGPHALVRPHVTGKASTGTMTVFLIGN